MIIIQMGIMGNFPTEWEILHDFCGMGVHGFDEMLFCFFVSYPTNDNHPLCWICRGTNRQCERTSS